MMAKRSPRIPELSEKTELKCKWGLFSIFESCQGRRVSRKLISNGRRQVNHQQIIEYPRKSDQLTRFDEECQKFQNDVESATDTKSRSDLNLIQEHMPVEKLLITKEVKVKEQECTKSESSLVDHLMESPRKHSRKDHHHHHHHKAFDSEEMSLNKITFAEVLRTFSPRSNNSAELLISEGLTTSFSLRKYDSVDEMNTHQVQMSAKALVDRMFIERRLKDQLLNSESKSFSNALEVLSSAKSSSTSKKERREAFKERLSREEFLKKSSIAAGSNDDEIVLLKPKSQTTIYSENVSCNCSSMHYHNNKSSLQVQESEDSDSSSFKKMKKRLKRRFGGPKGSRPFLTCGESYVLPQNNRPLTSEVDCSVNPKTKEKLWKRPDLKYKMGSDFPCEDRTKLDIKEFDVILEAKRHLLLRLENLNAAENDNSCKRPQRTLGRILLSPERDLRLLSPKKESEVFSGSAQMRHSPYSSPSQVAKSSFQVQIKRQRTRKSPSKSKRELSDKAESSILIPRGEEKPHDMVKSTDESSNSEVASERNSSDYMRSPHTSDTIRSRNEDDTIEHSISGSFSENEACMSTASSVRHLDIADTIKYQEEHQSPVSVLEPIFTEEANSPPSTTSETDQQTLQPLRINFDECLYDSIQRDRSIGEHYRIIEQDHILNYVQLVLQASCLNWDCLSEIEFLPEESELIAESLFVDVECPVTDHCYFDPKLLFDRINEILLDLYEVYCRLPPWLASKKPRMGQVTLEEVVIDKVRKEAEFYVLPRTERRTLDQLVSKDVANSRSWLDVRCDTEQILIEISNDVLEESILDMIIGFES